MSVDRATNLPDTGERNAKIGETGKAERMMRVSYGGSVLNQMPKSRLETISWRVAAPELLSGQQTKLRTCEARDPVQPSFPLVGSDSRCRARSE